MKKAAIIPAKSFGDALLMMICAHQLHQLGYKVTIFHDLLLTFQNWFSHITIQKRSKCLQNLDFDRIIIENDNSHFFKSLFSKVNRNNTHIFYPSYNPDKHLPLTPNDYVFDYNKTMVDNIALAGQQLFQSSSNKDIGLQIPSYLKKSKYINRIIIHPTSQDKRKNWHKHKFIRLANKLSQNGFNPVFCTSVAERKQWLFVKNLHFELPLLVTLQDFASYLYESSYFIGNDSGPGHLASYFHIPSIILTLRGKHMQLWQPGWRRAELVTPYSWVPNLKGCRLREKKWQYFVSVKRVYQTFLKKSVNCR